MKSAQVTKYDKNSTSLSMVETNKPHIASGQVLVKVLTAGVNPVDNMITHGEVKLIVPYKLPFIAGNEVVGVIEEIDSSVKGFNIGDRVFSRLPLNSIGAFAEYVAVDAQAIAKVPEYLSDEEAAGVPLTALTSMQALELMGTKPGETIFISGGTGSVGAMAIPIAKMRGLTVITSGSVDSKDRVLELGVDKFIDYKTEDYTKVLSNIDHVLDTLGGDETEKQMSIMKKGGHLVSLRGMPNGSFAKRMNMPFWKQLLFSMAGHSFDKMAARYGVQYDFIYVQSNGSQLQQVADLFSELKIRPSVDTIFEFKQINEALDKVANGRSKGKTVIKF